MGLMGLSSGLAQPDFTQDEAGETELHRAVRALMIAPNGAILYLKHVPMF